jgi:hypothetical protein
VHRGMTDAEVSNFPRQSPADEELESQTGNYEAVLPKPRFVVRQVREDSRTVAVCLGRAATVTISAASTGNGAASSR